MRIDSNQLRCIARRLRGQTFMGGISRSASRIKYTGEHFTPAPLVTELLNKIPKSQFRDPTKTVLDPACGDGQFLVEVLIRKLRGGSTFEQALSTIYGVDIMPDNVHRCRERLLDGNEQYRHIVERNIVCADASTYDYSFNKPSNTEVLEEACEAMA